MTASQSALNLIKRFESFRAEPYRCPAGKLTIGYGTTRGVTPDMRVTEAQAEANLRVDVAVIERAINATLCAQITQNQYDALVCLAYNIGGAALMTSTLLRKLNAGDTQGAADEFPRWNHVAGKVFNGLTRRRAVERDLFLS